MSPLPWLCPLDPPYNAVGDAVYAVGGGTDDTAALQACIADCLAQKKKMYLPGGYFFRTTSDLYRTATVAGFQRGFSIFGDGMLDGGVVADYNGDPVRGAVLRYDAAAASMYTVDSKIEHFSISQAPGRTGLVALQLTAAWDFEYENVKIFGMSGGGINAALRTDINIISDYYQDFSVRLIEPWIEGCLGWGINFGAGQSPGLYELREGMILSNPGGGIRSTTGQCEITECDIMANGTYGGNGGLLFATAEGPSMVAYVARNEFDGNFSWHVNMLRSRDALFEQNRFLSRTYASNISATPQSGTAFMRPLVQVNLGSGAANEVYNAKFSKNLHRSVYGSLPTTATCYGYDASGGSLIAAFPCVFEHNDFGPVPFDGVTQNSSGFQKFVGSMPGAVIIDP